MDANTRDSTVDLLESLMGTTSRFVWNSAKKYSDVAVTLKPCTPFG